MAQSSGYSLGEGKRSLIMGQVRRHLSTAFIKAVSLCTINRVANAGPGPRAAAKRREVFLREEEGMRRERRAQWTSEVERGGIRKVGIHFFPG